MLGKGRIIFTLILGVLVTSMIYSGNPQVYAATVLLDEFDFGGGNFTSPGPIPPTPILFDPGIGPYALDREVFLEQFNGSPMTVDLNSLTPSLLEIATTSPTDYVLELEYFSPVPLDLSTTFAFDVTPFQNDDPFAQIQVEIVDLSLSSYTCPPQPIPLLVPNPSHPPLPLFIDELGCPGITTSGLNLLQVTGIIFFIGSTSGVPGITSIGSINQITGAGGVGPVGGTPIPINTISLLLIGVETNALWFIPAIVIAGAGFAIFKMRKK